MWRKHMQDLSRGVGRPHTPLFAPLLFGVAAQLEAIAPEAMAQDPTRLRKNVGELRRMLRTDAVFCSAPSDAEATLLNAVGTDLTPEQITAHPRLGASLESIHQWQADLSEPVIAAALTGPASIAAALRASGCHEDPELLFDHIGRGLAVIGRLFCEAGIHLLQWHETVAPAGEEIDFWKGALGTAGNVARFHRVPPVLVLNTASTPPWPPQAVPCPSTSQHANPMPRPHGRAWPSEPEQWLALPGGDTNERLVTTLAEVPTQTNAATLLADVRRVQGAEE